MAQEFMLDALEAEGFEVTLELLPELKYRIILTRRGQRCLSIVRSSRRRAVRAAFFLFILPEQDLLDRLTLAERQDVLRVRQEMAAAV